jgi:hypothetical protein
MAMANGDRPAWQQKQTRWAVIIFGKNAACTRGLYQSIRNSIDMPIRKNEQSPRKESALLMRQKQPLGERWKELLN